MLQPRATHSSRPHPPSHHSPIMASAAILITARPLTWYGDDLLPWSRCQSFSMPAHSGILRVCCGRTPVFPQRSVRPCPYSWRISSVPIQPHHTASCLTPELNTRLHRRLPEPGSSLSSILAFTPSAGDTSSAAFCIPLQLHAHAPCIASCLLGAPLRQCPRPHHAQTQGMLIVVSDFHILFSSVSDTFSEHYY